jgi:hypothetical protein
MKRLKPIAIYDTLHSFGVKVTSDQEELFSRLLSDTDVLAFGTEKFQELLKPVFDFVLHLVETLPKSQFPLIVGISAAQVIIKFFVLPFSANTISFSLRARGKQL